ncbi:nitrate regulatory gene2 protein-like [Cynara cardunculus var. scolymus]|uniref:nitrate regulatory gene2 protein-like n=1 Tax=Cynara cardunculus var. scolymus TaxID=59895 RepID=UPI000D629E5D|nr:nitrate regulatory gene2 protein-like [Cynara cardunculus var. scolymus]
MGCSESKINNVETVNRCKQRKAFMQRSISARNAFAATHFAYAAALKNAGAALSDYAQGELWFLDQFHSTSATSSTTTSSHPPPPQHLRYDSLPPPPPPPPPHPDSSDFKPRSNLIVNEVDEAEDHNIKHSRYRSSNGGRARSGIVKSISKGGMQNEKLPPPRPAPWHSDRNLDRAAPPPPENDEISSWDFFSTLMKDMPGPSLAEDDDKRSRNDGRPKIPRKILENQREHDGGGAIRTGGGYGKAVEESEVKPPPSAMKGGVQNVNLLQVFKELADCFMKASESVHEVSKILEANRLHYHSNFADNRGHINRSTRVMRVITWNKSFKGPQIADDSKDDLTSKENDQTHATVLDKMLGWEKKLYDEVKACEDVKYEYKKKIDSMNKLRKRSASRDSLERNEAMISHLHTRCIVNMQSTDSTVSEINRLRDEQLYPKLVQLVKEMGIMWENMQKQHENQSKIAQALKAINISQSPNETSEHNLNNTQQLRVQIKMWHSEFQRLMLHQKEYVKSLNSWLKLNLISIDNSLKDKIPSPQNPKIQSLLRIWQDQLEKLPEEGAKTAINTFAAVIDTIVQYQSDEMELKDNCEETRRKLSKKSRKFEEWCDKQIAKRTPMEEMDPDMADDEVIADQQMVVEALKRRLEEEEDEYRRRCIQVKEKSLMNLKNGLPEVFTAMSKFSGAYSHMYGTLQTENYSLQKFYNN